MPWTVYLQCSCHFVVLSPFAEINQMKKKGASQSKVNRKRRKNLDLYLKEYSGLIEHAACMFECTRSIFTNEMILETVGFFFQFLVQLTGESFM